VCRYLEGELSAAAKRKAGQQRHAKGYVRFCLDVNAGKDLLQKTVAVVAVNHQAHGLYFRLHAQVELALLVGDKPFNAQSLNRQSGRSRGAE
jgi:hypothetical protein